MKTKYILIGAIAAIFLSTQLFALSPQIEADRLSLQAKTALDVKDFDLAMQSLEKIQTLGVKLPDTFYFHLGKAYSGKNEWSKARNTYEKYLNQTGTTGKFYKEALEGYSQADNSLNKIQEKLNKHQANMKKCESEYYEYRDSLEQDMERWRTKCGNYLSYGCRDYHQGDSDDRKARVIERAMEAAEERYYKITNQSDWCRNRYPE